MSERRQIKDLEKRIVELEQELAFRKKFSRYIIDRIPYPVFYKDTKARYTGCNTAFCEYHNLTFQEIIGLTYYDISKSDNAKEIHQDDVDLIRNKGNQIYESSITHVDDTKHNVIFNKSYFRSENGKEEGLVGVIIDITDQKEREKELEKKNEDIEDMNQELFKAKEKAIENDRIKSAFLENMSHEIRTPMNGILGFTELLKQNDLSKEDQEKYLDILSNRGNLLLKIINNIIDISKIEAKETKLDLANVSLNEIINEHYKTFFSNKNNEKKEHINLKVYKELSDGKDIIKTDASKLNQILNNLLDNAFKFTQKGWVEFGYEIRDDFIKFFIKDTGKGVKKEKIKFIFDRFRQEDDSPTRKYHGTGLGLTIAKAFVELLGGKIWIESIVDKGSSFYFKIPYLPADSLTDDIQEAQQDILVEYDWTNKSILIVEDDFASYEFLKNILSKTKVKIYWVDNGRKAIEMFLVNSEIDLVLMDIRLPDVDGKVATQEIKLISDVPIIAQTAHAFPEDEAKCREAGCDDFVTKPIDKVKLLYLIDTFFKKE